MWVKSFCKKLHNGCYFAAPIRARMRLLLHKLLTLVSCVILNFYFTACYFITYMDMTRHVTFFY